MSAPNAEHIKNKAAKVVGAGAARRWWSGRCNTIWVDAGTAKPDRSGNYQCDTANGLALLPGNALVFWK